MAPSRSLTLTEELEKLEQSITLTLQEIDHNFSRAHRIVTTSILPVVEQYAEHSKHVWESSKFWKQFFEASANVSLSGYEEPPEHDETAAEDANITTPSNSTYTSPSQLRDNNDESMAPETDSRDHYQDDSALSTTPPEISTPRPKSKSHHQHQQPSMAAFSSPYETLKSEIKGNHPSQNNDSTLPSTPRNLFQSQSDSSPFIPPSTARPHRTPKDDPLLHRILDKNWRLQATPHTTTHAPKLGSTTLPYRPGHPAAQSKFNETPAAAHKGKSKTQPTTDDDLDSSPALPAPELHSEIFGTPARRARVPGVSVLTPARGKGTPRQKGTRTQTGAYAKDIWDSSDSDDEIDEAGGMSPPKTMQFHIPQSRLLRTPGEYYRRTICRFRNAKICVAREASKKIVEDLLLTAGGNMTDDLEDDESPSVVKRGFMDEDDTF
ncbi:MAG: hypothetical protein LQ337_003901 [Flavoplaca oasis]|nr:MAG: hypothetical protein LQ337_003901 [Flavoplaca oasis]